MRNGPSSGEDPARAAGAKSEAQTDADFTTLSVAGHDRFVSRWAAVLESVADRAAYDTEVYDLGYGRLPTSLLPGEAQVHIDKHKQAIVRPNVLVLNHAMIDLVDYFDGTVMPVKREHDLTYRKSIAAILAGKDPQHVDAVFFDYPEYYVRDSAARLLRGQIQSVVLTPFLAGGSLTEGQAYREIGEGRTIYLAGCYLGCLSTTAEELWDNDNEIVVIEDAAILERDLARVERERLLAEAQIENLSFVSSAEFLRRFGLK